MPHKRNPIVSERITGLARLLRGYAQAGIENVALLLALVEAGRPRDEAYRIFQENAQLAWDTSTPFRELLAGAAPELELDALFDPRAFVRHAEEIVARLDELG